MLKVAEIFESLQGEGRYAGYPMLFIRTSGCTRSCSYCDTKYHRKRIQMTTDQIIEIIRDSKLDIVCWTGGEPLIQRKRIQEVIDRINEICDKKWHLETNGDLLHYDDLKRFDYIACSPKVIEIVDNINQIIEVIKGTEYENKLDIKIVTDLKTVGVNLLEFATMVMPLSTYSRKDKKINQNVWQYCVRNNIKFSPRLQAFIFGKKRGV